MAKLLQRCFCSICCERFPTDHSRLHLRTMRYMLLSPPRRESILLVVGITTCTQDHAGSFRVRTFRRPQYLHCPPFTRRCPEIPRHGIFDSFRPTCEVAQCYRSFSWSSDYMYSFELLMNRYHDSPVSTTI